MTVLAWPLLADDMDIKLKYDAQTFEESLSKVKADSQGSALWVCFMDGLKMSSAEVANSSKDDKYYTLNLVSLGGFAGVGDRVRIGCDEHIIGPLSGKPMPERLVLANELFAATLISMDQELFKKCDAKTEPDWRGVRELCRLEKQKFLQRLSK